MKAYTVDELQRERAEEQEVRDHLRKQLAKIERRCETALRSKETFKARCYEAEQELRAEKAANERLRACFKAMGS